MIGKLHVKRGLELITIHDGLDGIGGKDEKRCNGNDHAQHAKEDEPAGEDAAPCHETARFVIFTDIVE